MSRSVSIGVVAFLVMTLLPIGVNMMLTARTNNQYAEITSETPCPPQTSAADRKKRDYDLKSIRDSGRCITGYATPWMVNFDHDGKPWIRSDIDLDSKPFGTVAMFVKVIDGKVLIGYHGHNASYQAQDYDGWADYPQAPTSEEIPVNFVNGRAY